MSEKEPRSFRDKVLLGMTVASLLSRPIAWQLQEEDAWDEQLVKSGLESIGIHPFWDREPDSYVPPELQGNTQLKPASTYGKMAVYVSAQVRYENGAPFLGWDSARGGKTATVVSDALIPGVHLGERKYDSTFDALIFTSYSDGKRTGIDISDLWLRPLSPEVAYKHQDGSYDCQHKPGDPQYVGCQSDSFADDGLFTQDFLKLIQTSEPAELTKVAQRTFDALVEGTLRCGIEQQLLPAINKVYEEYGIDYRVDSVEDFAPVLIRALIRDQYARAGVPAQLQVVDIADKAWKNPPRQVAKAFKDEVQTHFNKYQLDDTFTNEKFCLSVDGAPAFSLDVAMSNEQIALGGLPVPPSGYDQANGVFSDDQRFVLDPKLFTTYGITNEQA